MSWANARSLTSGLGGTHGAENAPIAATVGQAPGPSLNGPGIIQVSAPECLLWIATTFTHFCARRKRRSSTRTASPSSAESSGARMGASTGFVSMRTAWPEEAAAPGAR